MRTLAALLLLLASAPLRAHDFWIEPSTFTPKQGELLTVRLRVGQSFLGDPVARDERLLLRFSLVGERATSPIAGIEGSDPAGLLRWNTPGDGVVAYESRPSEATVTPELFAKYVADEGLQNRVSARLAGPVVDAFSRCAKSLIRPAAGQAWRTTVGMELEVVPESDPWSGAPLKVQVLFRGKPLAGTTVIALDRRNPAAALRVVTDAKGRAVLPLASPGPWLVETVHILPQAPARYRSWWASMTFAR